MMETESEDTSDQRGLAYTIQLTPALKSANDILDKHVRSNGVSSSNLTELDKFIDSFNKKQKHIESWIQSLRSCDPSDRLKVSNELQEISGKIHELQNELSNATLYLRMYDRKVLQESVQDLLTKCKELEKELVPKKKFGFRGKSKGTAIKSSQGNDVVRQVPEEGKQTDEESLHGSNVGVSGIMKETITLTRDVLAKKDVVLKDLTDCHIRLEGVPMTVHVTNVNRCNLYFGPVVTSVVMENVRNSVVHLACQQLRIHESSLTDFYVHVTSKSVIEDCKNIRFGVYNFDYDGMSEDYDTSGLNRSINNWDQVDDFNWLIESKPSPNWSLITSYFN